MEFGFYGTQTCDVQRKAGTPLGRAMGCCFRKNYKKRLETEQEGEKHENNKLTRLI